MVSDEGLLFIYVVNMMATPPAIRHMSEMDIMHNKTLYNRV